MIRNLSRNYTPPAEIACQKCRSAIKLVSVLLILLSLFACHQATQSGSSTITYIDSLIPTYSHSFKIWYAPHYSVLSVYRDNSRLPTATYVRVGQDITLPPSLNGSIRINTTTHVMVCLSTTHVGALCMLNKRNYIAAAANTSLIYDSMVRGNIASGRIADVGHDYQPDYEQIMAVKPTVVFADGEESSGSQIYSKMMALHLPVVSPRDFYEQDPLARAEWIKFFAFFTGDRIGADSLFNKVVCNYKSLQGTVQKTQLPPSVFCNLPYNEVWYMPTGQNYIARLIEDAGGHFLWKDEKPKNGLNLSLSFEQVYERAAHADYWLNPSLERDLASLNSHHFKIFDAVKKQQVFNCVKRETKSGGMDIWESGPFRPDLVLSDLIAIFKGDEGSTLYYYQRLQ